MSEPEHGHGHHHDDHSPIEEGAGPPSEHELLEMALRELLLEKQVLGAAEITRTMEELETRKPENGAKLVARFWTDPDFRELCLRNGKAAVEQELGFEMIEAPDLIILEDTPAVKHVIVCTLCSCYPTQVLGKSPTWYRNKAYRARVVSHPREVLEEFGTEVPEEVEIRVVDSTAEVRYMVVPLRPKGSEHMNREELAALVSRDSLIGVAAPPTLQ